MLLEKMIPTVSLWNTINKASKSIHVIDLVNE